MSLSRSSSPRHVGGWAAPGLREQLSQPPSPLPCYTNEEENKMTWELAQARSAKFKDQRLFSRRNRGFFSRMSSILPRSRPELDEKDKFRYYRWRRIQNSKAFRVFERIFWMMWRMRLTLSFVFGILFLYFLFYGTPLHTIYRRTPWLGGGSNYVIVLGSNVGGGVMEWKGPREWAIERDSLRNKRGYSSTWGYGLEIVDMSLKKRYTHEWRESWEKVDALRTAMQKFPNAEWFWWLDLQTIIMEPSISIQSHIFNRLAHNTYRDIRQYNPLNIKHPFNDTYLDEESRSPVGDGKPESINIILSQDCSGFSMGSFFIRRSDWTNRLLDIWWDPVVYEQKHMRWAHNEQDAFEYLYLKHPWIRSHTAFLPQRKINSYPPGSCSDDGIKSNIHYNEDDRDFLINMAGCEYGRDCWGEMYYYRETSNRLSRSPWEKFKDWINDSLKDIRKRFERN